MVVTAGKDSSVTPVVGRYLPKAGGRCRSINTSATSTVRLPEVNTSKTCTVRLSESHGLILTLPPTGHGLILTLPPSRTVPHSSLAPGYKRLSPEGAAEYHGCCTWICTFRGKPLVGLVACLLSPGLWLWVVCPSSPSPCPPLWVSTLH